MPPLTANQRTLAVLMGGLFDKALPRHCDSLSEAERVAVIAIAASIVDGLLFSRILQWAPGMPEALRTSP